MNFNLKRNRSEHTRITSFKNENMNYKFIKKLKTFKMYNKYPDIAYAIGIFKHNLNVDSDNIILGAGSEELLKNIFSILEYESIQILEHSYAMSFYYNNFLNKKIITNPLSFKNNIFKFNDIEKMGGDVLYIVSPHCPSGIHFNINDIITYSKKFKYVIVDEAYINPVFFNKPILDNVMYVRTFSKLGGVPGMRLGYAIACNNIIDKLNCIRNSYEINNHAIDYLDFIFNNKKIIDESIEEYIECYCILKNKIKSFSVQCGNFATFASEKLNGKKYNIDGNIFTRVTLCDILNYNNILL